MFKNFSHALIYLVEVKLVRPAEIDLDEKAIQQAFEKDLDIPEEGLRLVGSYVKIGTGIIDTLAIDEEDNPVFIEYKKPGEFDKDALVQLMEYYSWFATDQNHQLLLKEIIQRKILIQKNRLETLDWWLW